MIVPQAEAYTLVLFCLHTPKACPTLAVGGAGNPRVPLARALINIRTMLTHYRSASFPRHSRSSLLSRPGREQIEEGSRAEGLQESE